MKELVFIKRNIDRWNQFENLVDSRTGEDPDNLASMFIQITDDLAFSRTFYPNSDTTRYLNHLASKTHLKIYKNKKEDKNIIKQFWKVDFPLIVYNAHKFIKISFLFFIMAALVGAFSSANDPDFVRLILGDEYVDMTLLNIEEGNPMGVYGTMEEFGMFVAIAFNNIKVSFLAYISGLLASIGTLMLLLYNGIMLGSFQYFFYEYGLLQESALTIWIHGTLEIFVIIVAGASGLILGSSMLFPNTYTRIHSFSKGVKTGIKFIIGILPIFIVAAFLEGYVTRHTEAPDFVRLAIILTELAFIIWYFFIYPVKLALQNNQQKNNFWTKFIIKIIDKKPVKKTTWKEK